MFKFLKDKLKKAVDKFAKSEDIKEEKPTEEEIAAVEEAPEPATEIEDTPAAQEQREKEETPESKDTPQKAAKKTPLVKEKSKKAAQEKPVVKPKKPEAPETTQKKTEVKESVSEKPKKEQGEKKVPDERADESFEEAQETATVEEIKEKVQPEAVREEPEVETVQEELAPEPKKKSFFGKVKESFTKVSLSEEKFEELFWDLELGLLENNVAVEVIEKIKHDLKTTLTEGKVTRKGIDELIAETLKKSVNELFVDPFNLVQEVQTKKPYVIAVIGVNGSGKTTTLAKIANMFQEEGLSVVMAAADTFRAAAIDQLQSHANNLGIKLISQGYGADPAAVAYDAIEHAKAKSADVVMIDTAGRLHSNTNLMAELEKVIRVAKPDLKIFIGESITGNDCVEQAQKFNELVGVDAIVLSKADIDEKGGAAVSVSYVTGKPILYLGTGQSYGDLEPFDKERVLRNLGF